MQCLVTGARNVNGYVQLLEKKKKAMKNILVYTNAKARIGTRNILIFQLKNHIKLHNYVYWMLYGNISSYIQKWLCSAFGYISVM